jgi:hypothetical protein
MRRRKSEFERILDAVRDRLVREAGPIIKARAEEIKNDLLGLVRDAVKSVVEEKRRKGPSREE